MSFSTDKQTLDDLNIFGRPGGSSIYAIFNRCATRGGAAILEEFFRQPLAEARQINKRSCTIQYFSLAAITFPVESKVFDAVHIYMSNTDERTKLQEQEQALRLKVSKLMGKDVLTDQIYKGIEGVLLLLRETQRFIQNLKLDAGHPYQEDVAEAASLVNEPPFLALISSSDKPTTSQMAKYDQLFRFRYRDRVLKLMRFLYHLDIYLSVAQVARERRFNFPEALEQEDLLVEIQGVYHPQVEGAVANDVSIGAEGNLIFLTGANMAGKSTFMKSLSICLYLAHMGFPIPASSMRFSVLEGIYTTINLPDNLGLGASHFYSEVLRVKKMAMEVGSRRLFILFDELFRGTNVRDAAEATVAIAEAFATRRNCIFVLSTHIIEAGEELMKRSEHIQYLYLPTRMEGGRPVYTYRLKQGITEDRHGMVIINNEGILEILASGKKI